MTEFRVVQHYLKLLLLLASVTGIFCQCMPVCDSYHFSTFPAAIDSDMSHSFVLRTGGSSLQLSSNAINVTLLNSVETCVDTTATRCTLHVDKNEDGNFTGSFTCSDLENIRGRTVVLVFEMESQIDESNCRVLIQSFVFEQSK